MKQLFKLLFAVPVILYSCSKQNLDNPKSEKDITQENSIQQQKGKWDKIYTIKDGKEIDITSSQNNSGLRANANFERFYEIATISPSYIFLGNVLTASSINSGSYIPVGSPNSLKPSITVSFSLPVHSRDIAPRKSSFTDAIISAIGDKNFSGRQSQVFTYKMKQITAYKEAKLAFGANINVASVFSIATNIASGKVQKTSALIVDFSQIYFNATMDIPDDGNIFRDEPIRQGFLARNPVYINSVNYGRKGIILAESDESYSELSVAIRTAFTAGIVNGQISVDANTKRILTNAEITICIIGGDGEAAARTVKGFEEFQNFIINGGVYTTEVYGIPISFGAAYASTNGMFETEFEL